MPYSRPIRVTGGVTGAATDIPGVIAFSWSVRLQFQRGGRSDGELGQTSMDMVGFEITGTLTADNDTGLNLLSNTAEQTLKLEYLVHSGASRQRTFDLVRFGDVGPVSVAVNPGDGLTSQYQVAFRAVLDPADSTPADAMAVGAGS